MAAAERCGGSPATHPSVQGAHTHTHTPDEVDEAELSAQGCMSRLEPNPNLQTVGGKAGEKLLFPSVVGERVWVLGQAAPHPIPGSSQSCGTWEHSLTSFSLF